MLVRVLTKTLRLLDCKLVLLRDGAIRTLFQDGSYNNNSSGGLHQNIGGGAQLADSIRSEMEVMGLPIKKWPGVSTSKSSIPSDKGVIGLEFRIPSICVIMVKNSSKVIFRFPTAPFK
ncbi:hypothetical protein TNCV_3878971 [Trichonephila clavipes]|nr:hypothetical protein TNCV_3878971 [Trichonephila clavipes]